MIAKHIPMKSAQKSDFAGLANYLTDTQNKNERVGQVSLTNCQSVSVDAAILEVLNTQALNKRTASDKTYHLLISFAENDQLSATTLTAIEQRICNALGYGEHQRISVVHHDTDNLHFHLAINKIHPTRYTIHEPYYPYKTLGALCESLEAEYGLVRTNHQAKKVSAENRADDMENHAGIESLLNWIKLNCGERLKQASSWAVFHAILAEHQLTLTERGNGFVIGNGDGLMVKASSVARELSKPKLMSRLGVYHEMSTQTTPAKTRFQAQPISKKPFDSSELYARYQREQAIAGVVKRQALQSAREQKLRQANHAKQSAELKRNVVKLMQGSRLCKKLLYTLIHNGLTRKIKQINTDYAHRRQTIMIRCQRQAWADWLRSQAMQGNEQAMLALRSRSIRQVAKTNTLTAATPTAAKPRPFTERDSITKDGTVIYHQPRVQFREDGQHIKVPEQVTDEGLRVALIAALAHYGELIKVNGTPTFKARVSQVAAKSGVPIRFDDPALETHRLTLLARIKHERETNDSGRSGRRVSDAGRRPGGDYLEFGRSGRGTAAGGETLQPNLGPLRREPPPERRNHLRNLSALPLVQFENRSEMLLPGDVSRHLEHSVTDSPEPLRRSVYWQGLTEAAKTAIQQYVNEREAKRQQGIQLPMHKPYDNDQGGSYQFRGLRHSHHQALALLQQPDATELWVMAIDEKTATALKKRRLGDTLKVSAKGTITRGRSR